MTIKVLEAASDKIETIPASVSGKYHPKLALGNGGLIRHIYHTLRFAQFFMQAYQWKPEDVRGDMVISALLLHDIAKKEKYFGRDYINHPIHATELMDKFESFCDPKYFKVIRGAVLHHMGPWTPEKVRKDIQNYNLIELIVYNSDFLASRKEEEFFKEIVP